MAKAATRTPPKRTRRVSAPFDARLEVRMYSTEKAKLDQEAAKRGLSASDLVRFQLGDLIAAEPPLAAPPEEVPQEPPVDLAAAIADALGWTTGKAMLQIALGKVTVAGELWSHDEIAPDLLPHVAVDGEPLAAENP